MKSYSQAVNILKTGKLIVGNEYIKSSDCLNRVCASNILSSVDFPSANNSSFDGYALNSDDTIGIRKNKSKAFKIIGSIPAGKKPIKKKN